MQINDLFNILHNAIESQNNGKKISLKDMANSFGISMRTYQDWKLGRAKPQAAITVMQMLGKLEDEEIIRTVRKINKLKD
ncbi:MAG: XRE family transcriptional regulator [Sulfurimonas sp.]|jgi:DNA-binding transcriptional regulator YiaG|uniref:XRE family transcriptional regulator n=1 Tax=unclassified Sulfurimonas TaxID=2623549 RepID=UPI0008BEF730|nr:MULTISPECIES: XRE family transcriptional regulator [unclassified Sulfurimonas]OHE11956.1 MAG: DNA-binding protein [Sulfurimonas sp. RIFOXYC2_FULL_36_7]OHE17262.1 MAG: DNA-binding protein [Sulfurimonas sp. RIFOXYD12_FULL_36_11]MBS4068306.1 XRE family transcriptional regulator [Sulfurimonas sp.]MDD3855124.1 XRE family transcriptional regulator [Sulfurimonas sp.]MDP2892765.1 XRE family transcriptional regulator [Sulfurimonas sp.]